MYLLSHILVCAANLPDTFDIAVIHALQSYSFNDTETSKDSRDASEQDQYAIL